MNVSGVVISGYQETKNDLSGVQSAKALTGTNQESTSWYPVVTQRLKRIGKMANRFEEAGQILLGEHKLVINKVRKSMSGFAPHEGNGIASPLPKTAKSFAILTHEVGHKALNHNDNGKSCLKEYEAEQFTVDCFKRFGFAIPRDVRNRINFHIAYGLAQALNRGMKQIPVELKPYRKYIKGNECHFIHVKNEIESHSTAMRYEADRSLLKKGIN
jgi:hypothetical protein